MSRLAVVLAAVLVAFTLSGKVSASSGALYGLTGVIETPDDRTTPENSVTFTGSYISKFQGTDANLTIYGSNMGLGSKMEFGYMSIKSDAIGESAHNVTSTKINLTEETADGPGIAIGMVDIGRQLKHLNPLINKSSTFVVFGRNLTSTADHFSRTASKPVKGTFGTGTGLYEGVFGSLDFYLTSQVEVKLEYLSKGLRKKSTVNSSVQFDILDNLTVQAGALAWEDFYTSVSYAIPIK